MSSHRHLVDAQQRPFRIVFLILFGFLLYLPVLSAGFIWDDFHLTIDNPAVRNPALAAGALARPLGAGAADAFAGPQGATDFYRPVLLATYMLDYRLWREDPRGYHLTNVLLHIAAGVLAYLFLLRLGSAGPVAFWAAVFFLAHPTSTEAVCYVSGRSDPLSFVFILAGLLFYLRILRAGRAGSYGGLFISYALALGTRESSVIFLPLLCLVSFLLRKRVRVGVAGGLAGLTLAYLFWRAIVFEGLSSIPTQGLGLSERLPGAFAALIGYLRLLAWPVGLHMEYGLPVFSWADVRVLSGLAALGALAWVAWRRRARDPIVSFSICWFLVALLPFSNLYPLNAYMAEHWLYAPLLGFAVLLSQALARAKDRRVLPVAGGALALLLSFATVRQVALWKDPERFYLENLQRAGPSARLLNNLATVYLENGRPAQAIPLFEKALAVDPGFFKALANLGNAYTALGKYPQAIAAFEEAIAAQPDYPVAYYNLGVAYQKAGREADAAAVYEKAVALDPRSAAAYNNLGTAYKELGRLDEAIGAYGRALTIDPRFFDAANNLGVAYLAAGDADLALSWLKKARAIDPKAAAAYQNLAVCHYRRNEMESARQSCREALARGLSVPEGLLRLIGMEEEGRGGKAVSR